MARLTDMKTGQPKTTREIAIKAVQGDDEPVVRLNANVPKGFYKRVKRFADDQETNITQLTIRALESYMSK